MSDVVTPLPIRFPANGIVPAVIQDAGTGAVLMVGFMNETALERTRATGYVHFWSRSRHKLWKKGESSGHVQRVREIFVNCDQNSLLIEVEQVGAVCHDGYPTCFYRRLEPDNALLTVRDRWFDPNDLYGASEGVAGITARWWGAYVYLRVHDLTAFSGTSRALHGSTPLTNRIADELRELAGALDGSHSHGDQRTDTLLEAGQVCYWTAVEAIRAGLSWEDVRPDRALDRQPCDANVPVATVVSLLRAQADRLDPSAAIDAATAHDLFGLVGNACLSMGLLPLDVVLRDLAELRTRAYLEPYFAP